MGFMFVVWSLWSGPQFSFFGVLGVAFVVWGVAQFSAARRMRAAFEKGNERNNNRAAQQ